MLLLRCTTTGVPLRGNEGLEVEGLGPPFPPRPYSPVVHQGWQSIAIQLMASTATSPQPVDDALDSTCGDAPRPHQADGSWLTSIRKVQVRVLPGAPPPLQRALSRANGQPRRRRQLDSLRTFSGRCRPTRPEPPVSLAPGMCGSTTKGAAGALNCSGSGSPSTRQYGHVLPGARRSIGVRRA